MEIETICVSIKNGISSAYSYANTKFVINNGHCNVIHKIQDEIITDPKITKYHDEEYPDVPVLVRTITYEEKKKE